MTTTGWRLGDGPDRKQAVVLRSSILDLHFNTHRRASIELAVFPDVQVGLAFRPRVPAFMNPEPLIRIAPGILLDHLCEPSGVEHHFFLEIAGSYQRYLGPEPKPVFSQPLIPY